MVTIFISDANHQLFQSNDLRFTLKTTTCQNMSYLLLHVVKLPDHVPSSLHERKGDPAIWYPVLQVREAWEPNEYPHEREAKDP